MSENHLNNSNSNDTKSHDSNLIPRVVREGLIECPKCGWKQSDENIECPMCDFKFPENNIKKNKENKKPKHIRVDLNKLVIKPYSKFISKDYKRILKNNNEFLNLIDNLDELKYSKSDLVQYADQIIKESNRIFIKNEENQISFEFGEFLIDYGGYISNSEKQKLKKKYDKGYRNYYEILKMDYEINLQNQEFIKDEGDLLLLEFKKELDDYNRVITDSDKEKFKKKYDKGYLNYYVTLSFSNLIEKYNKNIIKQEKEILLVEFKNMLRHCKIFISDSHRKKLKEEYDKGYCNFYNELRFDNLIDDHNDKFFKKNVIKSHFNSYISQSDKINLEQTLDIDFNLDEIIDEYNDDYIEEQSKLHQDFFKNIAGKSLDSDQIRAVLTDEDNTQIVAGAGTGKTLTIQGKVKYLTEIQEVPESDILCISFSRSAKRDLERKLEETLGENDVEVRTFHSIGNYILGSNDKFKEVPDGSLEEIIDNYFTNEFSHDKDFIKKVIDFFAYYYNIIHITDSNFKFQTIRSKLNQLDEYEEYLREYLQVSQISENKEYMKNFAELSIANFLFIHNIDYEYSKVIKYKHENYDTYLDNYMKYLFGNNYSNIPNYIKKEVINEFDEDFACTEYNFYPTFFLPEFDIYISLTSLKPNWKEKLSTENKEKWEKQLKLRKKLNEKFKTKLFTLYNYGENVGLLLKNITLVLKENGVELNKIDYTKLFELLILGNNLPEYNSFIKTISIFINIFRGNALYMDSKGNNISKLRFKQYNEENNEKFSGAMKKRNEFFLEIIENVHNTYEKFIQNDFIDFNNMINDAVIALRNGAYIPDYKYIIVDEYQDTSHTRYTLLKEMQKSTGAKVVVVGDDWQSIYGYTGCDVRLFSEFDFYFENPKMVKIQLTHRNSQDLIDVVGNFIKENKKQIPKDLISKDTLTKKPIKLVGCMSKSERVLSLIRILDEISLKKSNAKILLIGRNNNDIYEISCKEIFEMYEHQDFTQVIYQNNPDFKIEFRTVHKSKGLEADYVVVLNLTDKINGFPNKMENDPILSFVENKDFESIPYPEERRLFYVALTRTSNDVFLFHSELKPSIFVNEIKNNSKVQKLNFEFTNEEIIEINTLLDKKYEVIETNNVCPKCKSGNVNLIINNENGTSYFKCSNFCGWDGGPHHNNSYGENSRKISYIKYAKVCDECQGMLIVKSQRANPNKKFLGCNFHKKRNCYNSESLPQDFDKYDETIYNLDISRNGVYFLHDYIPPKRLDKNSLLNDEITRLILNYKNSNDGYAITQFTKEFMDAITFISNKELNRVERIALVAVPSSKKSRNHKFSTQKSINLIESWYKHGLIKSNYGLKKEILNFGNLLKRVEDVPTAHLGEGRASIEEHINSIECDAKLISEDLTFMILDDITTTGNTMNACKQILINNGVDENNIYMLTIGGTVRWNDEKI